MPFYGGHELERVTCRQWVGVTHSCTHEVPCDVFGFFFFLFLGTEASPSAVQEAVPDKE